MMLRMALFKQKVAEERRECQICGATGKHPKIIKHHMKKEHGVVEWEDLSKDVQERSYAIQKAIADKVSNHQTFQVYKCMHGCKDKFTTWGEHNVHLWLRHRPLLHCKDCNTVMPYSSMNYHKTFKCDEEKTAAPVIEFYRQKGCANTPLTPEDWDKDDKKPNLTPSDLGPRGLISTEALKKYGLDSV